MKLHKIILISCIMLTLAMFANGVYVLAVWNRHGPPRTGQGLSESDSESPGTVRFESSISAESPVNLMVLGLDKEEVRTDVIMLFNYSPALSKLNILSIARDTRVYSRGRYTKVNALYALGGEELLASKIRQLTGLGVNYFITLDFEGFRKVIDALGGVSFNVPFHMDYDDPDQSLHIHLDKGEQLLNGKKAEQLIRYRKGNDPGTGYTDGDIGRIGMQQEFLKALLKQKLNLRYTSKIGDIFGILKEYVKTNVDLADLSHYLGGLLRIRPEEVTTFTLPGGSSVKSDIWYYIQDEDKTAELIDKNFYK